MHNIKPTKWSNYWSGLLVLLMLWGTGWSFYRHGWKEGEKAANYGIYAMYRGIASLWEDPKWKDEFDSKTASIAVVLSGWTDSTGSLEGSKKILLEDIHEWLSVVPEKERTELEHETRELALAMVEYSSEYYNSLVDGTFLKDVKDFPSIQKRVEQFVRVPSFAEAWNGFLRLMEEREVFQAMNKVKANQRDAPTRSKIKSRFEEFNEKRKAVILGLVEEVYRSESHNG